jgi:hypothetical protein
VERAPPELVGLEQSIEVSALALSESLQDGPKQPAMHYRPHVRGQRIEGAEGRQLEALPHQFLDGHVDQIGRVVHHLGGLMNSYDRRASRLGTPASDLQVGVDLLVLQTWHVAEPPLEPRVGRALDRGHARAECT